MGELGFVFVCFLALNSRNLFFVVLEVESHGTCMIEWGPSSGLQTSLCNLTWQKKLGKTSQFEGKIPIRCIGLR